MGGDFDKGGPGLGLREAIKKAVAKKKAAEEKKKTEDKEAKKKAEDELNLLVQKLFDEMKIIETVSLCSKAGARWWTSRQTDQLGYLIRSRRPMSIKSESSIYD